MSDTQEVLEIIEVILDDAEELTNWEKSFLEDLKRRGGPFTDAQHNKVLQIYEDRVEGRDYDTEIY